MMTLIRPMVLFSFMLAPVEGGRLDFLCRANPCQRNKGSKATQKPEVEFSEDKLVFERTELELCDNDNRNKSGAEARRVRCTDEKLRKLVEDIANLAEGANFDDVNRKKNDLSNEKKQKLKHFVEEKKGRWNELKKNGVITEEFPERTFEAWSLNLRACKQERYDVGYKEAGNRGQGNGKKADFKNVLRAVNNYLRGAC